LFLIPNSISKDISQFTGCLISGGLSNLPRIDDVITKHLVNWKFDRLHAVDKAILRLSVYSLIYQFDIPAEVTIAEANELAVKYSDENSTNYINGILNNVKKEFRGSAFLEKKPIARNIRLKIKRKK
jgi:N utilization substance protein B